MRHSYPQNSPSHSKAPYATRGGIKLAHALSTFGISATERIALDIGAGEGGFTDVLLQSGVQHVFSIDVGYGKLDWKLRKDARVSVKERTNVRYLTAEKLYPPLTDRADLAVMDVAFISVKKILSVLWNMLRSPREAVILMKPQFEAKKGEVQRGGKILDPKIQARVICEIADAMRNAGWRVQGICASCIRGRTGNIEFFVHGRDDKEDKMENLSDIARTVVEEAHAKWNL